MNSNLSATAESFLRRLDKALWALPSEEREAVLLELRGHLEERAMQGPASLRAALADMGSPDEVAAEFLLVAPPSPVIEMSASRALIPKVIEQSTLPAAYMPHVPRLRLGEIMLDVRAAYRASGDSLWSIGAVLIAMLTATDFLGFVRVIQPNAAPHFAVFLIPRTIMILVCVMAAHRAILLRSYGIWDIDRAALRFAGAALPVILILQAAFFGLFAEADHLQDGFRWAAYLVAFLAAGAVLVRCLPWLAALAIERDDIDLRSCWQETRGKGVAIVVAWGALVVPLIFVHLLLLWLGATIRPLTELQLVIAVVDAIICALLYIAACLLNATVFRWVAREPIPEPLPFSLHEPTGEQILAAREHLMREMEARQRQGGNGPRTRRRKI